MSFFTDVARLLSFGIWPPDEEYLPAVGSLWVEKKPAITKGRKPTVFKVVGTGPRLVDYCITAHPDDIMADQPMIDSPGVFASPGVFFSQFKPLEIQPTQPWPRS